MSLRDDLFDYDLPLDDLERLARDGLVHLEPGIDQDEIFDDQFERRSRELNRKPYKGAQLTSVVTQRKGVWSGNNQLGFEQVFGPDANNEQTILKLDEWGMPAVWTVMLGITFDDELIRVPSDSAQFFINALVTIGVGGATQALSVDWKNGTCFSAPMNALNVVARYDFGAVGAIPDSTRLRVLLARGSKGSDYPATNSRFFTAGAGSFFTERIPDMATSVQILPNATPIAPDGNCYDPANLIYFTTFPPVTNVGGVGINGSNLPSFNSGRGLPIPRGVNFITFFCGAGAAASGTYVFNLGV